MNCAVVIQTCDRYRNYWSGMWHFMEKHWDFEIPISIYMCSENEIKEAPKWCKTIAVGEGTFVENLKKCTNLIDEENLFFMLEDFWPIAPMRKSLFESLYSEFECEGWDSLQVSNYTPYYKLKKTNRTIESGPVMEFEADSEWTFNFQARFWKKEMLISHLVEPEISEKQANSAITVEIECDKMARKRGDLKVALFHHFWYPISGVSYRGEITEFGSHLKNVMLIDQHVKELFG